MACLARMLRPLIYRHYANVGKHQFREISRRLSASIFGSGEYTLLMKATPIRWRRHLRFHGNGYTNPASMITG